MTLRRTTTLSLLTALALFTGCEGQTPAPENTTTEGNVKTAADETTPGPADAQLESAEDEDALVNLLRDSAAPKPRHTHDHEKPELPAGHPPLNANPNDVGTAANGANVLPPGHPAIGDGPHKGGLRPDPVSFTAPENWDRQKPSSSFRKLQFALPGPAEDAEPGELVVYFFGPNQGGSVDANFDRWRGQMTNADGSPITPADASRETFDVDGLKVHTIEMTGNTTASQMPGMQRDAKADQTMIAAIVETPQGNWFVKALGPEATMSARRDEIFSYIRSVEFKD